jgi:hypothetical protein
MFGLPMDYGVFLVSQMREEGTTPVTTPGRSGSGVTRVRPGRSPCSPWHSGGHADDGHRAPAPCLPRHHSVAVHDRLLAAPDGHDLVVPRWPPSTAPDVACRSPSTVTGAEHPRWWPSGAVSAWPGTSHLALSTTTHSASGAGAGPKSSNGSWPRSAHYADQYADQPSRRRSTTSAP